MIPHAPHAGAPQVAEPAGGLHHERRQPRLVARVVALRGGAGTLLRLAPIAGFFVLGGFGVFAVSLPELFPTEVRATGQGACFNLARVVTGFGTLATGLLAGRLGSFPPAGLVASLAFAFGLLTIWIGPETRGRTLQDVDRREAVAP